MAKVLIVEDDQFLVIAYRKKLSLNGYEVDVARDGEEAKVVLQTSVPDIILLDLVMPREDGFQLLTELKQNQAWKNIPVIVASNLGERPDIERAKALGAS